MQQLMSMMTGMSAKSEQNKEIINKNVNNKLDENNTKME